MSEFAKFSRFTNYYRHWHSSLFLYCCIAMQASVISIWLPRLIRFGLIQRRPNGIIVFRQPVTSLYTTADARRLTHRVKWRQCFSPIATADKVTCALAFASFGGRWKSEQKWTKWQYAVQTRLYAQTSGISWWRASFNGHKFESVRSVQFACSRPLFSLAVDEQETGSVEWRTRSMNERS